ncbi:MAG: hypothetical protein H6R10_2333 [Rhodocyclaceae bacterium]|nr:hypothetical protein [Rhodocyclaceae bacterium]
MALSPRQRWTILGGALAATLALVIWTGYETEEPADGGPPPAGERTAAGPAGGARPNPADPGRLGLGRVEPEGEKGEIRDLFPKQSWYAPPAEQSATAAGPPKPPPLPFTYLGRLIDHGRVTVYLADAEERNLAVRQGDVLDGVYKVKRISPAAVTFVYLPTNEQQTLEIGRTP